MKVNIYGKTIFTIFNFGDNFHQAFVTFSNYAKIVFLFPSFLYYFSNYVNAKLELNLILMKRYQPWKQLVGENILPPLSPLFFG
jgi:hypothetical protein